MKLEGSVALVTGANGGLGQEFVQQLLARGAAKVYLGARDPRSLDILLASGDARLVALKLDVTRDDDVAAALAAASDVTLVINNAGFAAATGALSGADLSGARQEMEVNYYGLLRLSRAFAPQLGAAGGGTIVNVLSFLSLVTMPLVGTYSASKAAALSATRSLRAELAAQGTRVIGAMPVVIDTGMGALMPEPKLSPADVVSDTLDAVEGGEEDVFPGELSRQAAAGFAADPKALQAQLASLLPAQA